MDRKRRQRRTRGGRRWGGEGSVDGVGGQGGGVEFEAEAGFGGVGGPVVAGDFGELGALPEDC